MTTGRKIIRPERYDVSHYDLRLKYRPTTDLLEGTATNTVHDHGDHGDGAGREHAGHGRR
ncbi:hypothetical protein [Streptomyces sp. NPDC054874]